MIDFGFQFREFISCSDIGAVTTKREVISVKRNIMWVTEAVTDAITALTRLDTFTIAVTDKAVRANTAGVTQVRHGRTRMWVFVVLATTLASLLVAFLIDRAVRTAID